VCEHGQYAMKYILVHRCELPGLPPPRDYRLPFEDEVPHPSLEQMSELVVNKKERPHIPDQWLSSCAGMVELIATIR